jgi:hypothetical protein
MGKKNPTRPKADKADKEKADKEKEKADKEKEKTDKPDKREKSAPPPAAKGRKRRKASPDGSASPSHSESSSHESDQDDDEADPPSTGAPQADDEVHLTQLSGDDDDGGKGALTPPAKAVEERLEELREGAGTPSKTANNLVKLQAQRRLTKALEDEVKTLHAKLHAAEERQMSSPSGSRKSILSPGQRSMSGSSGTGGSPSCPRFKEDGKADCAAEPWKSLFASSGDVFSWPFSVFVQLCVDLTVF